MSTDEEKYKNLRHSLRSLPKMKAKSDFESRLFSRIKELEHKKHSHSVIKPEKENIFVNWLTNLLKPSLVPALGLTVVLLVAIVVYFSYFNKLAEQEKQLSNQENYSNKNGELVIYVKKDGERIYDETNREITSADVTESSSSSDYRAPSDVSTDAVTIPEPEKVMEKEAHDKDDRISTEQKIEMEKESKGESDEFKIRSKSGDDIMKKGYKEESKKEAPSNYDRDKNKDTGEQEGEGNINPSQEIKQQTDEEEDQKEMNRVTERKKDASKKDSTKVKGNKTEDKDTIEK